MNDIEFLNQYADFTDKSGKQVRLYRIYATSDIVINISGQGPHTVKAGSIGGYVDKDTVMINSWVDNNARVYPGCQLNNSLIKAESKISNTTLIDVVITDYVHVTDSRVNSTSINGKADVLGSKIDDSKISGAAIIRNSTIIKSLIRDGAYINNSVLSQSQISEYASIVDSDISSASHAAQTLIRNNQLMRSTNVQLYIHKNT